jgi:hypothetical protein
LFRGVWDVPRCPRCGAVSSIFPEQLALLRAVARSRGTD